MKEFEGLVLSVLKTPQAREKYLLYFLRSRWQEIVGAAAAAHSQPYRLERGTLYIHTDNPMWSHTLLVMKGKFLLALREIMPKKGKRSVYMIRDLKIFHGPVVQDKADPEGADKAPFMRKITPEHRCPVCGVPLIEGEKICSSCARKQKEEIRRKIHQILLEMPWISFKDCRKYVDCDKMTFADVKAALGEWSITRALDPEAGIKEKAFAVMLLRGIPPEKLTDDKIEEVLASEKRSRYYVSPSGKQLHRPDRRNRRHL
jgi:predicted nucleic acid-binding Zn ribbon protein